MAALETVAIGLAPHSGWAAAVALAGPRRSPRVLVRTRIEMADPRDPESRQPYHAVEDVPVPEAAKRLACYMSVAERMAHAALQALEQDLAAHGCRVTSLGILESSGRKGGSLAATLASHALIHTADGDHFRDALAAAAQRCGLTVSRIRAKDLGARADPRLGGLASSLQGALKELGRQVGPPWGADQKSAALLAWFLLD